LLESPAVLMISLTPLTIGMALVTTGVLPS
jgi:hypothetical protein